MIDLLPRDLLSGLVGSDPETSVTFYLPTHRVGTERDQDPIRLEHLIQQARSELVSAGHRDTEAGRFLGPASDLLHDPSFWAELDLGLAIFLRSDRLVSYRLPAGVEELVVVGDRFHITPLVPFLSPDGDFFVLTLNRADVQLLRASRHRVEEVDLGGVPTSLEAALDHDDRERQLNLHGSGRVGGGQVTAGFHGHADDKDLANADLTRFFRIVDDGVARLIGAPSVPLVLAGPDRLVALYRRASHYPDLVDKAVIGNSIGLSSSELRDRAWPLVAPRYEHSRLRAAEAISARTGPTTADVAETVVAAGSGRVSALFVAADTHCWGEVSTDLTSVSEHEGRRPGDQDLLDTAATLTLAHRGDVFVVAEEEVPGAGPLAALLRF
jgi:hypothetical protein